MSAAACLFAASVSLTLPSTSTSSPASAGAPGRRCRWIPATALRCSPARRRGPVRALDERLLEAAAEAPAEDEDEVEVQSFDGGDGFGDAEGDGVGAQEVEEEQRPPAKVFVKSRRQRQEEEEAAAGQDRFKLINGKEIFQEKAYLVGVEFKRTGGNLFGIEESLKELEQLADTAGLLVVGSTYQKLSTPNPRTYIGSGKVSEIRSAIQALDVETVIFDDELSPGQLRNLEKSFGGSVRVCDRTALILDIFNQRAATHEAALQVTLAQMEYQLPRLTKMWSHLERQAGGQVKGMGEKQIEVDKRILRTQISALRKELESVRKHRKLYRNRRQSVPIPVVSLVGYTNAGKSTLLNRLTGADVLAEDKLFATLDPTTRRVLMKNGTEFLLTDTVGFIQKLPTMLVAAFRATLEEISESSVIVHLVDISHPLAQQQIDAVDRVLKELDVESIPKLVVWNKDTSTSAAAAAAGERAPYDTVVSAPAAPVAGERAHRPPSRRAQIEPCAGARTRPACHRCRCSRVVITDNDPADEGDPQDGRSDRSPTAISTRGHRPQLVLLAVRQHLRLYEGEFINGFMFNPDIHLCRSGGGHLLRHFAYTCWPHHTTRVAASSLNSLATRALHDGGEVPHRPCHPCAPRRLPMTSSSTCMTRHLRALLWR